MRFQAIVALAAATILVACGAPNPSDPGGSEGGLTWHPPDGLSAATSRTSYGSDDGIPVVFHNGSDQDVTTGALPCTSRFERRDGESWTPLVTTRLCIQLAVIIKAGTDLAFTADPPDGSGTYRIAFEVLEGSRQVTVRSGAFTVR